MALVHEKLYQSDTLSSLDLSDYVADLSTQLASLSGADERGIRIETRVEPMFIGLERAVPLGLLINEIVTNSIKHAFTDRDGGRIEIRIRREEGEGVLEIQDDGRGFPDLEQNAARQSLGLRLASTLAKQLDGSLQRENRPGAYSQVRFALEEPTQAKR
jgi:two-component sensor histidine kinase